MLLNIYIPEPTEPLLLAGQYPGSRSLEIHAQKIEDLVNTGIDTIINLMELDELERFADYEEPIRRFKPNIQIIHTPIRDMDIPSEDFLLEIVNIIEENINLGKKVYVHCWGGHGRTGTVVGAWLIGRGKTALQSLEQIKGQRLLSPFGDAPSPQTQSQINLLLNLKI